MDVGTLLVMVFGLVALVAGAELLVRGASALAAAAGVSPLVVGLTVVAFGTSAPELAVSVGAALDGAGELALGNVVGSNVFNVAATLGLAALLAPLTVDSQLIRREVPLLIAVSLGTYALALGGSLGRWEGALLVAGVFAFTIVSVRASRRESAAVAATSAGADRAGTDRPRPAPTRRARDVAFVVVGLLGLGFGAEGFVAGAVAVARGVGLSELVIGLTIVAVGTSLPELVTTLVAVARRQGDIAVGNAVGSSLFNLLAVLGATALIDDIPVDQQALTVDLPAMVVAAVVCWPVFRDGRISRGEGAALVVAYLAYVTWRVVG